jgi:hypothetical protein
MAVLGGMLAFLLLANLLDRQLQRSPPPRSQVHPPPTLFPAALRQFNPLPPSRAPTPPKAHERHGERTKSADAPEVTHEPQQPRSGEAVSITGRFKALPPQATQLLLEYQVVDPGKYIALHDAAFEKQWTPVMMSEQPFKAETNASERVFKAQIPGEVQKHRRLVRYRIGPGPGAKMVAPEGGDAQPNYAYFVYDGVPPWKGAINPNAADASLRKPVVFPSAALERVPVYHFISSKTAVETVTWRERDLFGSAERNSYKYTGTMVYDGIVYDHVGFRARGGSWRHAMGKNMWKFNFLPGHHFDARDDYGQRYKTKWDKLNLGACIQQGDYGMRGEQGMFEALAFRLFNLAGLEASRTHWVHFRIIDEPDENPANQYAGDFWGLYLAVENVDEHFLKEHDLAAGNLYKMDWQPKVEFNGDPAITDQSDLMRFQAASMRGQQPDSWWTENVDLPRYYDYRSIIECIHHYDVEAGKNYFYYRNPQSHQWITIPWDTDLTWGDHMYGGGYEPFYRSGLLFRSPFKQRYQERLAEIRDLLFNPEQVDLLIDEHAAMISNPDGQPSIVDADRAKWDYHPILASQYVLAGKAGQGRFYFGNSRNRFKVMVKYMKDYAAKRADWIDQRLLADYRPPTAPDVAQLKLDFSAPGVDLRVNSTHASPFVTTRWRLAEITDRKSPTFDSHAPWKYEAQAIWEQGGKPSDTTSMPTSLLSPGHTYRVRVRGQDSAGNWSRWSPPIQFTVPKA